MTQKELIYITTIAQTGTISKAADRLFIAQPSLSRCLQKIESDLGVELFKRTPEGLKLTMAGECYITSAATILKTYKELEIQLSRLGDMRVGKLTVGTTTFLGSFALPSILKVFHDLYPNIEIIIVEDVSVNIETEIMRGNVDLGILHTPLVTDTVNFITLAKERFLLAVPPEDPLNGQSYQNPNTGEMYLDIRLTQNRDYILTHNTQRTRQVTDVILQRAGIVPKIKYMTKSIQTAMRLVSADLGFTLVPHSYCSLFSADYSPNVYFIDEAYRPYWELVICSSPEIPLSRAAEELVRIATETMPYLYK